MKWQLDNFYNSCESFAKRAFGRFALGGIVGFFLAVVYWTYSIYFDVNIPVFKGIIGSLILILFCSAIAVYGNLEKLLEDLKL